MIPTIPSGWSRVPAWLSRGDMVRLGELAAELAELADCQVPQGWLEGHLLSLALRGGSAEELAQKVWAALQERR